MSFEGRIRFSLTQPLVFDAEHPGQRSRRHRVERPRPDSEADEGTEPAAQTEGNFKGEGKGDQGGEENIEEQVGHVTNCPIEYRV